MSALLFAPALTPRAHAQSTPRTFAGTVSLDFWKGTNQDIATHETLTFVLADKDSPRYITKTIPYASDGSFSFTIPQGNYEVAIKANRFLQSAGTADLRSGDLTTFALTLEPGDVDFDDGTGHFYSNNTDDVDDLTAVLFAFNTNVNDEAGSYDPNDDLDGDGKVDVDDLTALLFQFNLSGAPTPTPTAQWHIANVSLSSSGVVGSATLMGTVTLASPVPAGKSAVIGLTSSAAYYVTFDPDPAKNMTTKTVTIGAGQTTGMFTVYAKDSWTDPSEGFVYPIPSIGLDAGSIDATISASSSGWTQAASLTVVSAGTLLTPQNVTTIPGNHCALIHWKDLPAGTVKGYRLYRNGVALNSAANPLTQALYIDNSVANGTTYQYAVSVIGLNGVEGAISATISVQPAGSYPAATWVNLPTTLSGSTYLKVNIGPAKINSGMFLVDGQIAGYSGIENENGMPLGAPEQSGYVQTGNLTSGLVYPVFCKLDLAC